jgi:hypothetical protein
MFEHVWVCMMCTSFAVAMADCKVQRACARFRRRTENIIFYLILPKPSVKNADIRKTVCIYEVLSRANISYRQKDFSGDTERAENEISSTRSPDQTFTAVMSKLTH